MCASLARLIHVLFWSLQYNYISSVCYLLNGKNLNHFNPPTKAVRVGRNIWNDLQVSGEVITRSKITVLVVANLAKQFFQLLIQILVSASENGMLCFCLGN